MTEDGPDSLVLRYLRSIDAKLDRIQDLTARVAAVEGLATFTVSHLTSLERRLGLLEDVPPCIMLGLECVSAATTKKIMDILLTADVVLKYEQQSGGVRWKFVITSLLSAIRRTRLD